MKHMQYEKHNQPIQKCLNGTEPSALSDVELLSIIVGSGSRGKSVFDIASDLYYSSSGLHSLYTSSVCELTQKKGVGEVTAIRVLAALELGKRIMFPLPKGRAIDSPARVWREVVDDMYGVKNELFFVLILNRSHQLIKKLMVSKGTISETLVHPREIYKEAIAQSASAIIVCHNHPSGDLRPSSNDRAITERLFDAGRVVGIELIDHLIVSGTNYLSMREEGIFFTETEE